MNWKSEPAYWFFLLFGVAFLFTYLFTPFFRRLALWTGIVDQPDPRKVHKKPMPYLGGLGFYCALALVLGLVGLLWHDFLWDERLPWLLAGATLVVIVGLWDDVRPVREWIKLIAEISAAVIAYIGGFRVHVLANPFGAGPIELDGLGLLITVGWFVGIIVAINFIDGLDGLAAGVVFIATGSLMFVVVTGSSLFDHGVILGIVVGAVLAGTTLGFLPHNYHPARLFMGDAGSTLLGFLLAGVGIAVNEKAALTIPLMIPILGLAIPIYDTLSTVVRRTRKGGARFWAADHEHIHHRLLKIGMSHRNAVLMIWFACALLGALAVIVSGLEPGRMVLLVILVIAQGVVALQVLKFIEARLETRTDVTPSRGT